MEKPRKVSPDSSAKIKKKNLSESQTPSLRDGSDHIWKPVRFRLKSEGFLIEKYQNPLAVIHTTLKRLEEQGEVETIKKDGKTFYKWVDREETKHDIPF